MTIEINQVTVFFLNEYIVPFNMKVDEIRIVVCAISHRIVLARNQQVKTKAAKNQKSSHGNIDRFFFLFLQKRILNAKMI